MADASTHELVGCEVTLKGLNAKPELNGRLGKVKAWLPDRGRLQVKLLDDDGVEDRREAPLAVKPDNVETVDIADKFRNMKVNNGRTGISASAAADLLYTGGSIKPPADWDGKGVTDFEKRRPLYDELVLSFTLRVDDEYKFAGEMCGLFNYMADGHSRAPEKGSRGNSVFREFMRYVRRARKVGLLGSSWFTDENMEELATYAADSGYLYQAWEKSDVTAHLGGGGFTSMRLRGYAESVCKHGFGNEWFSDDDYSDGYYDSEDDDGEYDSEDDDGEYDSEDDDGEYDDEYDSEER